MAMRLSEKDDIALSISPQCSNGSQELQKKVPELAELWNEFRLARVSHAG